MALQLEFLNELLVTPRNMMKVLNHHPVPLRSEIASNSISFVRLENFRVAIFYPRKKHDASSLMWPRSLSCSLSLGEARLGWAVHQANLAVLGCPSPFRIPASLITGIQW